MIIRRKRKTENRKQKTENRKQKTVTGPTGYSNFAWLFTVNWLPFT